MLKSLFAAAGTLATLLLWSPSAQAAKPRIAPAPDTSALASVPRHAAFRLPHAPRGSETTVLYDQTTPDYSSGVPAQDFQSANDGFDSMAADDFTVTDVNGWTVGGFNFEMAFVTDGDVVDAPAGVTYNVAVYADNARQIGAAVCSYANLPGTYDLSNTRLSVTLPSACVLPTGTYWLSVQAVADAPPQAFWLDSFYFDGVLHNFGNVGMWKNPGDGFGSGCTDWTPVSECGDSGGNLIGGGIPNYLFQVVGFVNGNGGFNCNSDGICLQLTLAPANRDIPGLCGTATSLQVEAGDQVNFCYRVTNNSSQAFTYQSLSDNVNGVLFSEISHPLAPGETWQFNRTTTMGDSATITAGWTAQNELSNGYTATYSDAGSTDRVFSDGFDGTAPASDSGFIDITAIGTSLNLPNQYATANVTMPFSFTFYGRTSNLLCVGNSGDIQFGITNCENFPNFALPYLNVDSGIFAFWDNLYTHGQVYTAVIGDAPNRRFVVEWYQKDRFSAPSATDTVTFETIINEADGGIAFEYLDTTFGSPADDNGANATIGLQRNVQQADQYSYNQPSVSDGSSLIWTHNVPTTFTGSATVQIVSTAAHATVTPSALSLNATAGQATSANLTIGNTGNRDLNWNLREAASNAHLPLVSAFVVPMGDPASFSGGRAPLARQGASTSTGHARAGASKSAYPDVPAVAIESLGGTLQSFNAEQPRDWQTIGSLNTPFGTDNLFTGGDYLNGDYSKLYALNFYNNGLYAVSTSDGHADFIATADNVPSGSISGLKQDPRTGIVYVTTLPPDASGTSTLWTIDPQTAATTLVGPITNSIAIIDIAFNSLGQMYGIDIATDALVAIDKTTGQGSVIGSLGFNANYASGMAFDMSTDVLYFATIEDFGGFNVFEEMWTVDTVTGAATLISPVSLTPGEIQIDALAIARQPTACASSADVPWLSFDVTSGTTSPGQTSNVVVSANSQGLSPGDHQATVCVFSNDASQRRIPVGVTLTVSALH